MTNNSYKFRPPPARLFNSPPPTTKDQLGPPDSCTSLPLWLTQLGFSSFILSPILTLLLSYIQQTIHPASRPVEELTLGPLALSQTLNGNLLFLRFNSIPADASRSWSISVAVGTPEDRRGDTELYRKCSVIFDRGPETHKGHRQKNSIKILLNVLFMGIKMKINTQQRRN